MTTPPSIGEKVENFISSEWNRTIRKMEKSEGGIPPLPRPFVVPCADEGFRTFFYWDSYYACVGLLLQDRIQETVDVAENMRWLVEHFGHVPNLYEAGQMYRSQPPHYAALVNAILFTAPEKIDLAAHLKALTREHAFWTVLRSGSFGLNRYGNHAAPKELVDFAESIRRRIPSFPEDPEEYLKEVVNYLAEAESGWDFTTRYGRKCIEHLPSDLNSLLYGHELVCAELAKRLGDKVLVALWNDRAGIRRKQMNDLLWSEDIGAFADYHTTTKKRSTLKTAAAFYPLWMGVATQEQAAKTVKLLDVLEADHGLLTVQHQKGGLQWDAPNAWPPLQMAAILGCKRYGFDAEADRLAKKWADMNERIFEKTGKLWEKYNAITGTLEVRDEYPMPSMMGWSAGTYILCRRLLMGRLHKPQSLLIGL